MQNAVIQKFTSVFSSRTGTVVSVRRIYLERFNFLAADGLYVEDLNGDTLLYVGKVSANLNTLGMFKGEFHISDVSCDSAFVNIQRRNDVPNVAALIEKLGGNKPKNGDSGFKMLLSNVSLENSRFVNVDDRSAATPGRLNYGDMDFREVNVKSKRIDLIADSIAMELHKLSFRDKSGVEVENLSTDCFSLKKSNLCFSNLKIDSEGSSLDLPLLCIEGATWHDYKYFTDKVMLTASSSGSRFAFATLRSFAPSFNRDMDVVVDDLTFAIHGTINNIYGELESASFGNSTNLSTDFDIVGITNPNNARFVFKGLSLSSSATDITSLFGILGQNELPQKEAYMLTQAGKIGIVGSFDGMLSDFSAEGKLSTDVGAIGFDGKIRPLQSSMNDYAGNVHIDNLNIGQLLGVDALGELSMDGSVVGVFSQQNVSVTMQAAVSKLEYLDYPYRDIYIMGLFADRTFEGDVVSNDPNADFMFNGRFDLSGRVSQYDFSLDMRRADLYSLNINRRDSVSVLSCVIDASGEGSTFDDFNGKAYLRDLLYVSPTDSVRTGLIEMTGRNNERSKYMALNSSFIDIEYVSEISYRHTFDYFKKTLLGYLPSLSGSPTDETPDEVGDAEPPVTEHFKSDYSLLTLNVKSADNVAGIFVPGLQMAQGTQMNFKFNPDVEKYSLSLNSSFVEYEKFFISDIDISSENLSDSLILTASAQEVYVAGFNLPDFEFSAGAKHNVMTADVSFNDTQSGVNASLNVMASFQRRDDGTPYLKAVFNPSYLADANGKLDISADEIVYDSEKIEINNFAIHSGRQGLYVDGVISSSADDSLDVKLLDANLNLLRPLLQRSGFDVEGYINGYANLSSVKSKPYMTAEMTFDSLMVNDCPIDRLKFNSSWDFANSMVRMSMVDAVMNRTLLNGFYHPSDGAYMVDVTIDELPIKLLNPMLAGTVHDSSGEADIDLRVRGGTGGMMIDGSVDVVDMATTIDYTSVRYSMDNMRIDFRNSIARVTEAQLVDSDGHSAKLDMTFDMTNMSNIRYDVHLLPENMLVLDTSVKDNDTFYGRVFVSGAANVSGNKNNVDVNIVATTDNDSKFVLLLNSASNYSIDDFVTFSSGKKTEDTLDTQLSMRRMMYERRMRRGTAQTDMNISMTLSVLPNTEFQLVIDPAVDNMLVARGNASLNLNVNPKNNLFTIYGNYELTEGSYKFNFQNIIERQFTISPGSSIMWTGEPMNANLDISAAYRVKTSLAPLIGDVSGNSSNTQVDCIINLTDKLTQPEISFDVSVPNANAEYQSLVQSAFSTQEMMATQFFYLLAFGSFYSETSTSQNLNIGSSAGSAIGFDIITKQLTNLLSNDDVSFDFRYRPKSDLSSDEVEFGISRELIDDRLILEVEGNYDTGNNASVSSQTNRISGGGTLTYIMDKSGNLVLKGYSRTIDRFDENQGLQENGVGIYYNKSFNTFKELWNNFIEKIKGKRNKNNKNKSAN